mgnify:CR=1 FL=1
MWPPDLPDAVRFRTWRCLRKVPTFVTGGAPAVPVDLGVEEEVLGVYEWPQGMPALMVTTIGLRAPPGWEVLPYNSIVDVRGPRSKTESAPTLTLGLSDGQSRDVVIGGIYGQFQDVWAFVRFLSRVSDDARAR